ncbi:MAG: isocitrate lyase/phosphoenolpyruvate mutase family protein [Acidobacteriota bacterium]
MSQSDRADTFHQLHRQPPLILPNAWDAGSARLIEQAGAPAIATTSAGVAWALGRRDGHGLSRQQVAEGVRTIVAAVDVPVTADCESGYGDGTEADVAETVRAILGAGAVGINLEDAPGHDGAPLLTPEEQAGRIRAARQAARDEGIELFLNARTDVYLRGVGEPSERRDHAIRRAAVYLEAGASGIFIPGVVDTETITALASAIDAPLNVMAGPGAPTIGELADLGVARVSLGPKVALAAFGLVERATREVLSAGTYETLETGLDYFAVNRLFPEA